MRMNDSNVNTLGANATIAAAVVSALEEEIALGQIGPRERLVEEDIARRFEIKRHVARQALADLEVMGLVVRHANRGAVVRHYTAEDVEQLYVVRTLVEACAAALIPLPAEPSLVRLLQAIQTRHGAAVRKGDLRRVFRENLLFHETFFGACGNQPLAEVIQQLAMKAHSFRSYSIGNPQQLAQIQAEHSLMITLLQGSDRKRLVALVSQHILPAKTTYLQLCRHLERPASA